MTQSFKPFSAVLPNKILIDAPEKNKLISFELTENGGWLSHLPPYIKPKVTAYPLPINQVPPLLDLMEAELFVGREKELEAAALALSSSHLVEIYGPMGVGKTLFARYLIHHSAINWSLLFVDGIVYRQLHPKQTIEDILESLFHIFYRSEFCYKPSIATVQKFLENLHALIIFDDAALSQDQVCILQKIAPRSTFLLISRAQSVYEAGVTIPLRGLLPEESFRLVELAVGNQLSPLDQRTAESLCAYLKGNCLEILQQLAQVQKGVASLLVVNRRVERATSKSSTAQLLRTINDPQHQVLQVLAIFGKTGLLAQQVSAMTGIPDAKSILENLRKKHLVQFNYPGTHDDDNLADRLDTPRYSISPNLIEFLPQQPLVRPVEQATLYFTKWLQQEKNLNAILRELDAIVELLQWGTQFRQRYLLQLLLSLVESVDDVLLLSNQWGVRKQILQWSIQVAEKLDLKQHQAFALYKLGLQELCSAQAKTAKQWLTQAMELYQSQQNQLEAIQVQRHLQFVLPQSQQPSWPFKGRAKRSFLRYALPALLLVGSAYSLATLGPRLFQPVRQVSITPAPLSSLAAPAPAPQVEHRVPALQSPPTVAPQEKAAIQSPSIPLLEGVATSEATLPAQVKSSKALPPSQPAPPLAPPAPDASTRLEARIAPQLPSGSSNLPQPSDLPQPSSSAPPAASAAPPPVLAAETIAAPSIAASPEATPVASAVADQPPTNTLSEPMCQELQAEWQATLANSEHKGHLMKTLLQKGNCSYWGIVAP